MRVCQPVIARHGCYCLHHPAHGADVGRTFRHRIKARQIGESVKINRPVKTAPVHLAQQFQRGLFVHRPHHQPVIALGVTVVQMQPQQPRMTLDQGGGTGRLFTCVKRMREIQRHPKVFGPHLPDRQKRGCRIRQNHIRPWFVWFIFDGYQTIGVMCRHFGDAVNLGLPQRAVIALKGVVIAVLPQPQGHHRCRHGAGRINAALGQINCFTAHFGVRVGKRPSFESRVRIVPHREPADAKPATGNRAGHCDRVVAHMIGIIQVKFRQPRNGCRTLDHLQKRRLAGLTGPIFRRTRCKRIDARGKMLNWHAILAPHNFTITHISVKSECIARSHAESRRSLHCT